MNLVEVYAERVGVGETLLAHVAAESAFLDVRSDVNIEIRFVDEDLRASLEVTCKLLLLCVRPHMVRQI